QTGLLTSLHYFAGNSRLFLRNFYLKSKRSILKAKTEGPAGYVLPADEARPGAQAELLRTRQKQGGETSRATASFTGTLPARAAAEGVGGGADGDEDEGWAGWAGQAGGAGGAGPAGCEWA